MAFTSLLQPKRQTVLGSPLELVHKRLLQCRFVASSRRISEFLLSYSEKFAHLSHSCSSCSAKSICLSHWTVSPGWDHWSVRAQALTCEAFEEKWLDFLFTPPGWDVRIWLVRSLNCLKLPCCDSSFEQTRHVIGSCRCFTHWVNKFPRFSNHLVLTHWVSRIPRCNVGAQLGLCGCSLWTCNVQNNCAIDSHMSRPHWTMPTQLQGSSMAKAKKVSCIQNCFIVVCLIMPTRRLSITRSAALFVLETVRLASTFTSLTQRMTIAVIFRA